MNREEELDLVKHDLLELYGQRKEELDPLKIQNIEQKIAKKLETWGELLNKHQSSGLAS